MSDVGELGEFEEDPFLERLLNLRDTDPAQFNVYPEDVKRIVAEYEREKRASKKKEK